VESWKVALFAAGTLVVDRAPDAAAGSATTATAVARTSQGRVSSRTSASA
jgi:hypothetical protein